MILRTAALSMRLPEEGVTEFLTGHHVGGDVNGGPRDPRVYEP